VIGGENSVTTQSAPVIQETLNSNSPFIVTASSNSNNNPQVVATVYDIPGGASDRGKPNTATQNQTVPQKASTSKAATPTSSVASSNGNEPLDTSSSDTGEGTLSEEATSILPLATEDENTTNTQLAGLAGFSDLPLWGVIVLALVLIVLALRYVVRKKGV
jgi:cobalamin biosynthesis Mg chelatase CobN